MQFYVTETQATSYFPASSKIQTGGVAMTTAPSFSPANPEPKIYLALSHDDFISVSPAIFRPAVPPFSCRFLTCHPSRARLYRRFALTCLPGAHLGGCREPGWRAERSARRHLLFQLREGPPRSWLSSEGCGRLAVCGAGGAVLCGIPLGSGFTSNGAYSRPPLGSG